MAIPFWKPDDGEWHPAPGEEMEGVFEWADDGNWIARRSADEWLLGRAAQALAADPFVHGRRLEIVVQNGVVILLGELGSAAAREAASLRVWAVDGVRDVSNQLTVGEPDAGNP